MNARETTVIDKGQLSANVTLLKQKLMFPDFLRGKELIEERALFLREMDSLFDMIVQQFEHNRMYTISRRRSRGRAGEHALRPVMGPKFF
jgi:hypothetical protein